MLAATFPELKGTAPYLGRQALGSGNGVRCVKRRPELRKEMLLLYILPRLLPLGITYLVVNGMNTVLDSLHSNAVLAKKTDSWKTCQFHRVGSEYPSHDVTRTHPTPFMQSVLESLGTGFALYRHGFHGVFPDGTSTDWKLLALLGFCDMWNGVEVDTPGTPVMISDCFLAVE
jgi:hypothetical protein